MKLELQPSDIEAAKLRLAREGHLGIGDEEMRAFMQDFFAAALRSPYILDAYEVFLARKEV